MNARPKILTLIGNYLPGSKAGGPLRTIANMVDHLSDELEFWIITRDRDLGDTSPYADIRPNRWQRVGGAMVHYLPPERCRARAMAELIASTEYDVMYLNSFFEPTFTIKPLLARRLGWLPDKPVVIAPRGEFSTGAIKIKYPKKYVYIQIARLFRLYDKVIWQASSAYESQDIERVLHESPAAVHVATNLPGRVNSNARLDAAPPRTTGGAEVRIVFLSRISPKKNLDYALRVLRDVKASVVFDIYGPAEDVDYWKRCTQWIKRLPANVSVNYMGSVHSDLVASVFSRYDVFFFPTRGENYGHVIAEALSVGTSVLLSDQTPWRGLQPAGLGWDIPLDEPDRFVGVIDELAATNQKMKDERRIHIEHAMRERLADPQACLANRELFRRAMHSR